MVVKLCLGDPDPDLMKTVESSASSLVQTRSSGKKAFQLFYCFVGLQASYLVWGVLQEKIMTQVPCVTQQVHLLWPFRSLNQWFMFPFISRNITMLVMKLQTSVILSS